MSRGGIRDLAAYEPAQLKGKYQFASIDASWYYGWLNDAGAAYHYYYWYCAGTNGTYGTNPKTAIVESLCPSAMVDNSGVLYTVNFFRFSEFKFAKYTPSADGRSVSSSSKIYYLWDEAAKSQGEGGPGYRDTAPYTHKGDDHWWTTYSTHNILSPTIAQEVSGVNSNSIYLCFICPPKRWLNNNMSGAGLEGLWMMRVNKSDLGINKMSQLTEYGNYDQTGWTAYWPPRLTSWKQRYQPEWGPCKAAFDNTWVHCFQVANSTPITSDAHLANVQRLYYKKINASSFSIVSYSTVSEMINQDCNQCLMFPRFQKVDSDIYFCTSNGGGFSLGRWGATPIKIINTSYQDHVLSTSGYSPGARYPSDFCILKNGSQHVACFLGLKATGYNSDLSATYGWSNSSINWNPQHLACILYSDVIPNPIPSPHKHIPCNTNLKTSPSNIIYNTQIARANGDAVNSFNATAADIKRLYLNTQNLVIYTSTSGHNYIIYAYCYPGKTKQCYLGYAPYSIDAENHIHLMTKREFRDKSGNSFGDFTDCSRIISMDLKNGHLWITFIRGDSNGYYYFHILAKDLVGE